MNIGAKIKKFRLQNKMTQTEFANKIGKSLSIVQKYENGAVTPPIYIIEKIADALNISINELYLNNESADLENKYNELLQKCTEIENENSRFKSELKELHDQKNAAYDLIKYQREKITELENKILSHD